MMNNILYIGPYREFSGMGNAARQYIKALIHTGHNISIRPTYNIFKPYATSEIDNEILDLESNSSKSYHTVIQHCYPHQLTLDKRFEQNVALVHFESFNYNPCFAQYMEIMDNIIVGSNFVQKVLLNMGLDTNKIRIIPEPIDLDSIRLYQSQNAKKEKDSYSFYTICDFIDRKNLDKILLAYILAYDYNDNIELVIKTKNLSDKYIHIDQTIEYLISKAYSIIDRTSIPKPKVVLGETKYDAISYIHNNNDCFINASSGESFGFSTLEAMAFNNNLIINDKIGSSEILSEDCGLLTDVTMTECMDPDKIYSLYNNIDNMWFTPTINSMILNMHKAANENNTDKQHRIEMQNHQLQNFCIESVAKLFDFI